MNDSSDDEENTYEDSPETPNDGENINASSDDEGYYDDVATDPPTNDLNINYNSDDEINYYEVTPDTPTNCVNNETIYNHESIIMIKKLSIKTNDKETEETEVNEEDR